MIEIIGQILPLLSILMAKSIGNYRNLINCLKINWILYIIGWLEGINKEIKIGIWYITGNSKVDYTYIIGEFTREVEILICTISIYVVYYSHSYMGKDKKIWYIIRILIFKSGMELIVRSKESILLFVGWELIGWMSYLLVNYWSGRIESEKGSLEGIIMNKIGDIFIIYNLSRMNSLLGWKYLIGDIATSTWYLLIGSMVKSAQLGFQSWLTKSMAGPTPISALIHSSTLVTAGILLLYRCESMTTSLGVLRLVGSGTLVYSIWNSFHSYDFKKLIAWSTSNQMGILVISLSENINMIDHIITHGLSKSLWFLSVGKIIERQDIRRRGSERDISSYVYRVVGSINICGLGFTSGTLTKESILLNVCSYVIILSIIYSSIGTIEYTLRSMNININGYNKEKVGEDKYIEELLKSTNIIDYSNSKSEILISGLTTTIGTSVDWREILRDGYEVIKREVVEKYMRIGNKIRRIISNGAEENIWIIRWLKSIRLNVKILGDSFIKLIKGIIIWLC